MEAFELSTERRALERQEFEQQAAEKEALRMRMEEEQRREQEQKEKEEITRMRQEQVTSDGFVWSSEPVIDSNVVTPPRCCFRPSGPLRSAHQTLQARGREEE